MFSKRNQAQKNNKYIEFFSGLFLLKLDFGYKYSYRQNRITILPVSVPV